MRRNTKNKSRPSQNALIYIDEETKRKINHYTFYLYYDRKTKRLEQMGMRYKVRSNSKMQHHVFYYDSIQLESNDYWERTKKCAIIVFRKGIYLGIPEVPIVKLTAWRTYNKIP